MLISFSLANAKCIIRSCNHTISYAIQRYADKTTQRMYNLKSTFKTLTNRQKILTKIELQKINELKKEKARLMLYLKDSMKLRYLSQNIKKTR